MIRAGEKEQVTIRGCGLAVASVLLEPAKEPGDTLLIVFVVLALDDDLLEAMNGIRLNVNSVILLWLHTGR